MQLRRSPSAPGLRDDYHSFCVRIRRLRSVLYTTLRVSEDESRRWMVDHQDATGNSQHQATHQSFTRDSWCACVGAPVVANPLTGATIWVAEATNVPLFFS